MILLPLLITAALGVSMVPIDRSSSPETSFKCFSQMQPIITKNKVKGLWQKKMKPDLTVAYVRPTQTLSRWMKLEKRGGEEWLMRETPFDQMILRYDANCQSSMTVQKVSFYSLPNGFTDFELARTLKQHRKGLVYAFSPGMNLSFEGLKNIREVARSRKLPLTVVLDPYADVKKARQLLNKHGMADVEFKKISSLELVYRNTLLHFPNLTMFKDGAMTGPMIPGLLGVKDYDRLVKKYLE